MIVPGILRTSQERILWATLWARGPRGRRGLPIVLVGDPGTAKTTKLRRMAALAGMECEALVASLRQPHEFLGLPTFSENGGEIETRYAPPRFATNCQRAPRTVLFLDEVTTCAPATQAALLRVTDEGVVGEADLPAETRILLAMNTPDDAGGWDLSLPLANRLGFLEWPAPSLEEFTARMMSGGGQREAVQPVGLPEDTEEEFDAEWPAAWAAVTGAVAGFLRVRPALQHQKPSAEAKGYAWPSSRSWENAMCALAACRVFGLTLEEQDTALVAFVGKAVAAEYAAWTLSADLPDPAALLDGKSKWRHSDERPDRTAAVLTACAAILVPESKDTTLRRARAGVFWKMVHDLPDGARDLALVPVETVQEAKLLHGIPDAYRALAKMEQLLQASGALFAGEA